MIIWREERANKFGNNRIIADNYVQSHSGIPLQPHCDERALIEIALSTNVCPLFIVEQFKIRSSELLNEFWNC